MSPRKRQREKWKNLSSVTVETNMSQADEIEKFAALRDKGIITEEEFNQKKVKILGM